MTGAIFGLRAGGEESLHEMTPRGRIRGLVGEGADSTGPGSDIWWLRVLCMGAHTSIVPEPSAGRACPQHSPREGSWYLPSLLAGLH